MEILEKTERCLDCNDSKSALIGVHNFGLFGDKVYLCDDCYNVRFGNNPKKQKPSYLKLIK
jgi:hypothetical protein